MDDDVGTGPLAGCRVADFGQYIAVRPRNARTHMPGAAPKYGAHTRKIFEELGYDGAEVEALLARGVVAEGWSEHYLPD